ncbi:hypothetical protein EVAR_81945_1 [Eumeta japonica]|uniref:DUF7044 domain-containing protein n=1 Tax=Eumeta variegata TaxID=151549 RepID=A0A4C1ZJE5_EUMVA|nr:hypothetical protein EVAR_81945_1 [Eumeta japonica]
MILLKFPAVCPGRVLDSYAGARAREFYSGTTTDPDHSSCRLVGHLAASLARSVVVLCRARDRLVLSTCGILCRGPECRSSGSTTLSEEIRLNRCHVLYRTLDYRSDAAPPTPEPLWSGYGVNVDVFLDKRRFGSLRYFHRIYEYITVPIENPRYLDNTSYFVSASSRAVRPSVFVVIDVICPKEGLEDRVRHSLSKNFRLYHTVQKATDAMSEDCYRCMVIHEKHESVLQYKESEFFYHFFKYYTTSYRAFP